MPNHITDVKEFKEAGILLQTRIDGKHTVRVLGALEAVPLPGPNVAKEDMAARATDGDTQQYLDGSLKGPQDDAGAEEHYPVVPSFFITRDGEAVFLKREWK